MSARKETIRIEDAARGRVLETLVVLPATTPAPLVVFGHGYIGHPRKFTRLFETWRAHGFAVAAPRFPLTAEDAVPGPTFDDVPSQPADLSLVLDEMLARFPRELDATAVALAGFSMGAVTVLAAVYDVARRDPRVRAAISLAGAAALPGDYDFSAPPLLLVQMRGDRLVPYAAARDVLATAGDATLVSIDSVTHHEGVEDEPLAAVSEVVDRATTAFLELTLRGDLSARARLDGVAALPGVTIEHTAAAAQPA